MSSRLDYSAMMEKSPLAFLLAYRSHKNEQIDFDKHQYLKEIYGSFAKDLVVMKSTQCGLTEYLVFRTILETLRDSRAVFYVMPTEGIRNRFVINRLDLSCRHSGIMANINVNNSSLKQIGKGVVSLVGSKTPAVFTEFPADTLIIDELDQCDQSNLQMAGERLSASVDRRTVKISNPTILNFGIDYEYNKSDKRKWQIKCECGKFIFPDFFQNVIEKVDDHFILMDRKWHVGMRRDIYLICHECGKPINRFGAGKWVATAPGQNVAGYHISKLFSTAVTIQELVDRFNEGLVSDIAMQRFYNGDMGVAYTAEGAKLSPEMLDKCVRDYPELSDSKEPCVIGVDVGNVLHTVVGRMMPDGSVQLIRICELHDESELHELFKRYRVLAFVIDSAPELRLSRRMVASHKVAWMCSYSNTKRDSMVMNGKMLTVDRTASLDGIKEHVMLERVQFPRNARSIEGFYDMMCANTRVYNESMECYVWTEGNSADHYFHALNYMLIAKKLIVNAR